KTKQQIYLSFENFEKKAFKQRFPNIYANLKDLGYELPFEKVPISLAFHYSMGGIEDDLNAKVLNCKNLYAVVEVSCFGLHVANRLASNYLLEGLVLSKIVVGTLLKDDFKIDLKNYTQKEILYTKTKPIDKNIKVSLRRIMWDSAGIIREKS